MSTRRCFYCVPPEILLSLTNIVFNFISLLRTVDCFQKLETLTPTIMNMLLEMSNDMLLWLRDTKDRLNTTLDVRGRRKMLKTLKQAEMFLNFVYSRLQSKFFNSDIADRPIKLKPKLKKSKTKSSVNRKQFSELRV